MSTQPLRIMTISGEQDTWQTMHWYLTASPLGICI